MPRKITLAEPDDRPDPGAGFQGEDTLSWLFLFRLLLIAALIVIFAYADTAAWLPQVRDPTAAHLVLHAQALLILLSGLLVLAGRPAREQQIQLAVFVDLVSGILLIHFSGGVAGGFGLLPAIAVTVGALLLEGRLSLLFAALAALGVITEQLYTELYLEADQGSYLEAGFLGLIYFSVALLAHVLMRRLRVSERLAARRKVDLDDLSTLNEYVIQSLSTGVVVIDGARRIRQFNAEARRLLGSPRAGRGAALQRLAPELMRWFEDEIADANPAGRVVELHGRTLRPRLHLLGDARSHGALILLRDQQELLRETQDINLAALGRLSASIAHNIRNPLSAVSHAGQLLAESPELAGEERHLTEIIRRNAERLDEIVTSVLELSRRHQAQPDRLDLCTWVPAACRDYRERQGLVPERLHVESGEPELRVRVDQRHLRQILSNLCDNALEHGATGGRAPRIRIQAERSPASGELQLSVADDGPGVPAGQRETIFEPFYTTLSSGTGLGLYAARELAEANGMRLEYSGDTVTGSRFTLTFSD